MQLSTLTLENFRSYPKKTFGFSPQVNLILGHNGSGKTNILESIFFLASGKSFRSSSAAQLISWDQSYTIVTGLLDGLRLEVQLVRPANSHSLSRQFLLDSIVKTRKNYLGTLKVVIFEPDDIRLVTGSPTRRRNYLDSIFLSSEWRYSTALSQYHRALRHRNELLDLIRVGQAAKTELFYWDQSLIKNNDIIEKFRHQFVSSANQFFSSHSHPEIRTLSLDYYSSPLTQSRLDDNYSQEIVRGYTAFGCHRSDFSLNSTSFSTADQNLAFWGSRGQQRLAVLALRLAQINYLEEVYSQQPLLLLDDIFSELDIEHRQLVVDICHKYQTILTSAEDSATSLLPTAQIQKI